MRDAFTVEEHLFFAHERRRSPGRQDPVCRKRRQSAFFCALVSPSQGRWAR